MRESTQMSCGAKKSPGADGFAPPPQRARSRPSRSKMLTRPRRVGSAPVRPRAHAGAEAELRHEDVSAASMNDLARPGHVGPFRQELARRG